ncbi:hypothetical protein J5X84_41270 [Streptosporangiaceae bacterium NEAU-GS5]|nr:hypothetical protein [Streptosporangiaceae bacterium NEAU-GS5]
MRVILVSDAMPRAREGDDRGYGLPLVTTDLVSPAEDLVARYAARWCIEVAFFDARQSLGVGQARNRTAALLTLVGQSAYDQAWHATYAVPESPFVTELLTQFLPEPSTQAPQPPLPQADPTQTRVI